MRLFAALDPPLEVRDEAARWGRAVARSSTGVRAVPTENIHITLAFFGERSESEAEAVAGAIDRTWEPVPGLSLGAPVWLPRRRPRALALEIHDDGETLRDLHKALAHEFAAAIDWKPERSFRPHLTAARLGRKAERDLIHLPVGPAIAFAGESVSLYRSHLEPGGVTYEALDRWPLVD